jgi:hypothetical protein
MRYLALNSKDTAVGSVEADSEEEALAWLKKLCERDRAGYALACVLKQMEVRFVPSSVEVVEKIRR